MAAVIDANLALVLFLRLPYTERAFRLMEYLRERRSTLSAPRLWEYECLSGFHRAVRMGVIRPQEAVECMDDSMVGLRGNV